MSPTDPPDLPPHPDDQQRLLKATLRCDLISFLTRACRLLLPGGGFQLNWHLEAIADALEGVAAGRTRRLIINVPPRHLKSVMINVVFVAWLLGHDPTRRVVSVSYSELLADKHARDCRQLMESAEYQALFPGTRLSATKNSVGEYETTRGGYRLSTSVGGTLTGRGGNLIILDDPQRPEDATSDTRRQALHRWYDHTLYSRLDNKMTDAIVLVMQRLHVEDLVGHVLLQEPWTQLSLPALAEADTEIPLGGGRVYHRAKGEPLHATRESPELLAQLRRTLGAAAFSAQYQQEPMPAEGALLQWGWFKTYQAPFRRRPGDVVILSWDTASLPGLEHDYSVGQTWIVRGTDFYLAHVHRGHWNYPELKARVFDQIRRLKPYEIIIEQANTGIALVDELRAASREGTIPLWLPRIRTLSPSTGKAARLAAESAVIESGCVWLPDEATWLEAFRQEVLQFPYGRYDDQMDAMSQFLFRMRTNIFQPPAPPDGPPEPELPPRRRLREGWPRSGLDFGR